MALLNKHIMMELKKINKLYGEYLIITDFCVKTLKAGNEEQD